MSGVRLHLSLIVVMLFAALHSYAQTDWKLKKEDEGIKVYVKNAPNSNLKSVRVNCEMRANLSQVVGTLMDVKNTVNWIYRTKSAILLKQLSPSELYYYSEVQVPWPAQNRDFIAHLTVTQNPQTKTVTIEAPCIGDYIPEKPGIVRVRHSEGHWVIKPKSEHEVEIEYTITLDPGGNLPSWIVNLFAAEGPTSIIKGLRKEVAKPGNKNTQLPYIIN